MTGVTGAYTHSFEQLEDKLEEINKILKSSSVTNDELRGVQHEIDKISTSLTATTASLDELDADLASNRQAILQGGANLDFLRQESDDLKHDAQEMKEQITTLQA